jgi:hypothetical protein
MNRNRWLLLVLVVAGVVAVVVGDYPVGSTLIAVLACYVLFRIGFGMVGTFARPVPEPPPPGELRRVKIQFRCSLCGTEVRMTVANDEMPDAPRHCMEEMELVAPVME